MSGQIERFQTEAPMTSAQPALTPVEYYAGIGLWLKRDDLFRAHGANGGKARVAQALMLAGTGKGVTTCGARMSPQVSRVAALAQGMGMLCTVHVPTGDISTGPVCDAMQMGANVVQHRPGYMSVLRARARTQAQIDGYTLVPFGCVCPEAVAQTRGQVYNLPSGVRRLVVPVGSGMTLAGICWGLEDNENPVPVLGVRVGGSPRKVLDEYAPAGWQEFVTIESSLEAFNSMVDGQMGDVTLDPMYEAKCLPFLREGDCLWVVGYR